MTNLPMDIATPVRDALQAGQPVVALESTIITHGMPYPDNLLTAQAVEQVIRDHGALPATIAVLEGRLTVGLSDAQLTALARTPDVMKLSRADLPFALATGQNGSTTVAATMIAAELAGIAVFATGGIGGVHRGVTETFDISADLQELARSAVTVVCAGAKAILDLPKTFEQLETLGVPVVGYQCAELPAFWSRQSGIATPLQLDSAVEIAGFMEMRQALSYPGGVLVCNPIPAGDEIPAHEIAGYIDTAIENADQDFRWFLRAIPSLPENGKSVQPATRSHYLEYIPYCSHLHQNRL